MHRFDWVGCNYCYSELERKLFSVLLDGTEFLTRVNGLDTTNNISGKEDAANNYARGHYTIGKVRFNWRISIRRLNCPRLVSPGTSASQSHGTTHYQ